MKRGTRERAFWVSIFITKFKVISVRMKTKVKYRRCFCISIFQIVKEIETKVEANQEVNRVAVEEKGKV